jgi:hypothetical protein
MNCTKLVYITNPSYYRFYYSKLGRKFKRTVNIEKEEAAIGIEPMDKGFADLCLTTWLRRLSCQNKGEGSLFLRS